MNTRPVVPFAFALVFAAASLVGCSGGQGGSENAAAGAQTTGQGSSAAEDSDEVIQAKLTQLLQGVTSPSESDYPYTVFEADGQGKTQLDVATIRALLGDVVKQKVSSHRDIRDPACNGDSIAISETLADLEADENDHNSQQTALALTYMMEHLKGAVGAEFGTTEAGDQDSVGPVVFVYVGISPTTGKLIGILTEAVFT